MRNRQLVLTLALLVCVSCRKETVPQKPVPSAKPSAAASVPSVVKPAAPPPAPKAAPPDPKRYPWLGDKSRKGPIAHDTMSTAIPTPPGYERVELEKGSFGAWLRDLPLAPPGTPVLDFRGREVFPANDQFVQAVVAIDVGDRNLQQSVEAVIRLEAEWAWASGRRDQEYKAATKDELPYQNYVEGKRPTAQGGHLYWIKKKDPSDPNDHSAFRNYLDAVYPWVNSAALRMQSEPVDPKNVRPGDFFLQRGKGGFEVIVLDIATKPSGERVALLGQSLYPAMNIHVARLGKATPWFSMRPPDAILTGSTNELSWSDLRRLEPRTSAAPQEGK